MHHSDRGSQYVSIKYTERLAEAGMEPSVGSVGNSYDNALAETINGLYKAEVIHRRGHGAASRPSSSRFGMGELVQQPTAARAHRQHPAAEAEQRYYACWTSRHGSITWNQNPLAGETRGSSH